MGIDDESSHPELCSEVAGGVTRNLVCLFREPDAGNLPVRFDEREQETELCQTGLRRVVRKTPNMHRGAKATAPVRGSPRTSSTMLTAEEPGFIACSARRERPYSSSFAFSASVMPSL